MEFTPESMDSLGKGESDKVRAQKYIDRIQRVHQEVEQQLIKAQHKYKARHD